jgi:mercuric reductase
LLDELGARDLVVLDGGRIIGAYPFTDADTGYRVTWDSHAANTMCAVDALGIGAMLGRETAIVSRCRHCGAPIRIETRDGGRRLELAEPEAAVVWLSTRYEGRCVPHLRVVRPRSSVRTRTWRCGEAKANGMYRVGG